MGCWSWTSRSDRAVLDAVMGSRPGSGGRAWLGRLGRGGVALDEGGEPPEAVGLGMSVAAHPALELAQRLGPQRVEPALAVGAHRHQAGGAEDAQGVGRGKVGTPV